MLLGVAIETRPIMFVLIEDFQIVFKADYKIGPPSRSKEMRDTIGSLVKVGEWKVRGKDDSTEMADGE